MKLRFFILFIIFGLKSFSNVSDTIHVSHYKITIDTVDYSAHTIRGNTELTIHSRQNGVNNLTLGLYRLTIDSIISSGSPLSFSYDDTLIRISPPSLLNLNDSVTIQVYYNGNPKTDPTFGGFYFNGQYAFNIGVGFDVNPHNFGKAWFPCLDEFTDRSTYEFHITTTGGYKAFCNGLLQSTVSNPNGTVTWNWQINQTIPTYLAALAIAPFYTIERTYQGIPVELGVMPGDTANTLNTFQHLDSALLNCINGWGSYPWDRVGFVMVPFNAGAMEHATSIHVGKAFVNGSLTYETLWAHELSHMWFGDKVTCKTEEDMWLNEGWATYNENFFTEFIYGHQAYENERRRLHRSIVQYTHMRDGGYFALDNIPHSITYGYTVYQKGSDVIHSIRRFLGDSLFFPAVRSFLDNHAYDVVTSIDLRDDLAASSGISMDDYFATIVSLAGFPHVSVDSFTVAPNGSNYNVTVFTRQQMRGNNQVFALPVELNLTDASSDTVISISSNATLNTYSFTLPFAPVWIGIDRQDKLTDAIVDYEVLVDDTGTYTFPETYCNIRVLNEGSAASPVRIINNYVTPDAFLNPPPAVRLSDYHYYKVEGVFASGFHAKGSFGYDGSPSFVTGYMDHTLLAGGAREDSLLLYYREHSGRNWELVNGYSINFNGSHLDKKGWVVADTLKTGEYVLAVQDFDVSVSTQSKEITGLTVSPNPAIDQCRIEFKVPVYSASHIRVTNMEGQLIFQAPVYSHQDHIVWDTWRQKNGLYFISLIVDGAVIETRKTVLLK